MVGIYKITNPEGKSYIGLSKDIEKRFKHHKSLQFKGNNKLKESLIKYDKDTHLFEILEEIDILLLSKHQSDSLLRKRERYWINLYKTFDDGLNENRGGSGCGSHTEESKQKISQSLKGKPKPVDFGEKRKKWQHDEEWREKISESLKGKSKGKGISRNKGRISPNEGKGKPVLQYDKDMNFLKEYLSLKDASFLTNTPQPCISECLRGKHKTAGGYIWKYKL
jgi:group I intron endonuclease